MSDNFELHDILAGLVETEDETPSLPAPAPLLAPWPAKLSFDVALGESSDEVLCSQYNISEPTLRAIYLNPLFRREVSEHQAQLREHGVTFRAKAKVHAEMYLENVHDIIISQSAAPSVKLDAIKSIVKWAGYEPKPDTTNGSSGGPSVTININRFSDDTPTPNTIQIN